MDHRLKIIALLLALVGPVSGWGQEYASIGNLVSASRQGRHINIRTSNAHVRISVYDFHVFRVRAGKEAFPARDFSYSVIAAPTEVPYRYREDNQQLTIQTDSMSLVIQKKPLRFSFYDAEGRLLNADDPGFGIAWTGHEATVYKTLQDGERFVGLGEKTGDLDRRGSAYINWNSDVPGYDLNDDPLYVSIPFYIGVHHGLCYGIFLDNTSRTHFNFGASNDRFSSFTAESGDLDYYFIGRSTVPGIIEAYTALTGRMPLPPVWSLGYQQCRWSYFPDKEVLSLARTFREKDIPLDVLYLDIHYMDAYKIFTWNKMRFPQPATMIDSLRKLGVRTTVIVDPGIKVEPGYQAYEDGLRQQAFARYPDNTLYAGSVWPGLCHFPDFTKPAAREWWGKSFGGYVSEGVTGFWNDMNEPATWGQAFPSHVQFDFDGRGATTLQVRNVYGMQMARATYEGVRKLMNGQRPFVLTRAGFAGVQRYSAVWTGDNTASDDHMMLGVRLVNSLGLGGVAFAGVDIGGFAGEASSQLYARWLTIGVFSPMLRGHKMINMRDSEPWSYGEEVEAIARHYLKFRYKMLPYIYSAFYDASRNGMPVSRSLAIPYTHDPMVYDRAYQQQYMFGPSLMVAPAGSQASAVRVYFPPGRWYDLYTDSVYTGGRETYVEAPLHRLPVFVRGGSVLPLQATVPHTGEQASDTLFVHLYAGEAGEVFTYYEDDGLSYAYEDGAGYRRRISSMDEGSTWVFEAVEGAFPSKFRYLQLIFHGLVPDAGISFSVDGSPAVSGAIEVRMVYPGEVYREPLYYARQDVLHDLPSVTIPNYNREVIVRVARR